MHKTLNAENKKLLKNIKEDPNNWRMSHVHE